jgi:hypothetical protein
LKYQPSTRKAMTQSQGRERAVELLAGIENH